MNSIDETKFPANPKTKRMEKVANGKISTQKTSLGKAVKESLFGEEAKGVMDYVLWDILIPAAKTTISEAINSAIEMALFGETKGNRTRRDRGTSYVSYSGYSRRDSREKPRQLPSSSSRDRGVVREIILESRSEGEEVLSRMAEAIEEYGVATVANLYDLVGMDTEYTHNKYGWDTVRGAQLTRVREGYLLVFPEPIIL